MYAELYRLAERCRAEQPGTQGIGATTLVGEVCLLLLSDKERARLKRNQLLAAAASAMREILVSHARARRDHVAFDSPALDQVVVAYESRMINLPALEDALQQLAKFSPDMARAVELRFFAGLSLEEVAEQIGMPQRTFERQWAVARVWLCERMG